MSIVKLRQTAAPGGPRTRWDWGCLLAASIVAGAGCDQRNLAVISLSGVPSGAMATTAYYRLDGSEWKSLVPQRGLQQFGIELPKGRSAKLETQIFTYANRIPCSLGNAEGGADLDGGSIRELALSVTATTNRCSAAGEPADFPQGKMVVWANAANDIWLAGTGGKIVHWDGFVYTKVPLPASLAQAPPDWNAILGDGPDIWLAGTSGAVAYWTGGVLSVVPLLRPMATDWRSLAVADDSAGTIVLAGTNRTIGVADAFAGIAPLAFSCGAVTPAGELTAVGCPLGGSSGRCFFVTDRGGIASLQLNTAGMPLCKNVSSPTTTGLFDVFVGVNLASQAYDVRIVGKGGVALRATTPILSTTDPNFLAANTDYSSFIPPNARVDLNRVSGTSIDDLWIAGQGGVLLRWKNTTAGVPPVAPFAQSPTGTTADLSSLSGFGSNLLFSGASHTLGYIGQLFTPS